MSKFVIVPVLMVALLIGRPIEAQAGDEGWAALGGFLGGALLTRAAQCRSYHASYAPVVTETVVVHEPIETGHYEYRTDKEWVPGYWSYVEDRCGRIEKVWHPGRYEYVEVKVWVPHVRRYAYHSTYRRGSRCRY